VRHLHKQGHLRWSIDALLARRKSMWSGTLMYIHYELQSCIFRWSLVTPNELSMAASNHASSKIRGMGCQ
jgi:hypothetical protein